LKDEKAPPRSTPFQKEIKMKRNHGFDEVMIVNPYEPGSNDNQGVRLMRFYAAPPGMGYYAESPAAPGYYPAPVSGYGYYAQAPGGYGYYAAPANGYGYYANLPEQLYGYAEPSNDMNGPVGYVTGEYPMGSYGDGDPYLMGYYGQPMGYYGYYGQPTGHYADTTDVNGYGYYGQPAGHYADTTDVNGYGYYGQPTGHYADTTDVNGYGGYGSMGYYANTPEMPGYGQMGYYADPQEIPGYGQTGYYADPPGDPRYEQMAAANPDVDGYGAYGQGYAGYVREADPAFNAGCPMPTNVHGYGDPNMQNMPNMFEGYVKPSTVNPMCGQFTPQPGQEAAAPDTFKPLW
jgi:hypothetical protein